MRLETQALGIRFGSIPLLQDINLSVASGEVVGLIGPNGSGKTTLLRVLAGLRPADTGIVTLDGRDIHAFSRRELAKYIAYLAQSGDVHWPMRVDAVVRLGRLPHRQTGAAREATDTAAVEAALQSTDVVGLRHRTMTQLSGGERMRVLLARALAVQADLLLADEPVAALDPLHQLQAMDVLRSASRNGTAVIVVLHDLSLAARFCDRLVLIADGGVVAVGRPPAVLTSDHLTRAYGVDMVSGEASGIPYFLPRGVAPNRGDQA